MYRHITRIVFLFWVSLLFVLFSIFFMYVTRHGVGVEHAVESIFTVFRNNITVYGIAAPLIFVLLFALRPILFFPATVMVIASVLMFGVYIGFGISFVGDLFSSTVAYVVGKYFGKEFGITKIVSETNVGSYLRGNAFPSVFTLRIVPIFPFDLVSYAAGVLVISYKKYILATMLGIIPGLTVFIFLGNSIVHTKMFPVAIFMVFLLIGFGIYIKKRVAKKL